MLQTAGLRTALGSQQASGIQLSCQLGLHIRMLRNQIPAASHAQTSICRTMLAVANVCSPRQTRIPLAFPQHHAD